MADHIKEMPQRWDVGRLGFQVTCAKPVHNDSVYGGTRRAVLELRCWSVALCHLYWMRRTMQKEPKAGMREINMLGSYGEQQPKRRQDMSEWTSMLNPIIPIVRINWATWSSNNCLCLLLKLWWGLCKQYTARRGYTTAHCWASKLYCCATEGWGKVEGTWASN